MHFVFPATALLAGLLSAPLEARDIPPPQSSVINCGTHPGRGICREMRRLESYIVPCTGVTCYEIWGQQLRSMEAITDSYYDYVEPSAQVDRELGSMARSTSRAICGSEWIGDATWIRRLAISGNRTLKALYGLQLAAYEPVPYTCSMVVNRSVEENGDVELRAQ